MALQRKNFRCPRDGTVASPVKGNPLGSNGSSSGLVVSHAELPPRQRKRVQVGSTNLFRSISTPELPAASSSSTPQKNSMDGDVSSAAHNVRETNIALIKSSMSNVAVLNATAASNRSSGVVVLSEKRRLKEMAHHVRPQFSEPNESTSANQRATSADRDGHERSGTTWSASAETAAAAAERAFFLEKRNTLYNAFVDRYGSVRAVFKAFDRDANGLISYQRFADMVETSEVALSPADIQRVFRHVDKNGDNSIEYQEFSEMFTASEYVEHASAYSPAKAKAAAITADPTSSLALKFRAPLDMSPRTRERMKELRLKVNGELLHKHGRDVSVHGGKTENLLVYAFKQFDTDNDGFLSYDQVKSALGKDYLQLAMDAGEMDEMVRMIDRNADEQISMKEFVQYFGAGERELPTDLIDNGRRKELAALHYKSNIPLTPRHEIDPEYYARRDTATPPVETMPLPSLDTSGCMQENLARRVATSPVFRSAPLNPLQRQRFELRAQTPHTPLKSSRSTPSLSLSASMDDPPIPAKHELGPTLNPLVAVSQDRHTYWRLQHTDWTRVGVGGDGVRAATALFGDEHERFQTTTQRAFSPMQRGVNSGDVFRDEKSTSELEAQARAARRHARHDRTQALVTEMELHRAKEQRLIEWTARAKVRLGAARRFAYLDKVHEQEQRVAMREQQMAKRHGGARFHRMWAGSAESQFNNTHVADSSGRDEGRHFNQ